jgi:hypothetical protein
MFVVWRRRAITTDRKTPFFYHYVCSGLCPQGERWRESPDCLPAWMDDDWSCSHRGAGRETLTPYLMRSVRVGGSPRQQVAWRLPAIRTCCVEDGRVRAAWWHCVHGVLEGMERGGAARCHEDLAGLIRCKKAILEALVGRVPRPSRAERLAFEAFAAEKEAERQRRRQEEREQEQRRRERAGQEEARRWWQDDVSGVREAAEKLHRLAEEGRRREEDRRREEEQRREEQRREEQRRQQEREQERRREERRRQEDERRRRAATPPCGCWKVLGLPASATLEQVKARFRELAKAHHPDRGGDNGVFVQVQRAFEEAQEEVRRRG